MLEAATTCGSRVRTALALASVEGLSGDAIVLGFLPDASFQREAVSSPDSKEALAAVFEKVLGRRLRVETTERTPDPQAAAKTDPAARAREATGERLSAAERASAEQSPLTRLVERELKARIVSMERADAAPARAAETADPPSNP